MRAPSLTKTFFFLNHPNIYVLDALPDSQSTVSKHWV